MYVILECLGTLLCVLYSYVEALVRMFIPTKEKSVKDQLVLITGGAKGIGREVALRLAEKGARLIILDMDAESNRQTAEDIRGLGADVYTYVCDVTSRGEVAKTAASVRRDVGNVDMLFNNAGIANVKRITELSEKEIRKLIDINLVAHFWTLQEFLPSMIARNAGHVITTSSFAGLVGSDRLTDYCATKFAVRGLTEAMEVEVLTQGITGIKFTTVYPLFTNTNLMRDMSHRVTVGMRFGEVMEPGFVGEAIVNGVLRDKRDVFIPNSGSFLDALKCLVPRRGRDAVTKLMDIRYIDQN